MLEKYKQQVDDLEKELGEKDNQIETLTDQATEYQIKIKELQAASATAAISRQSTGHRGNKDSKGDDEDDTEERWLPMRERLEKEVEELRQRK
eukprot:UN00333